MQKILSFIIFFILILTLLTFFDKTLNKKNKKIIKKGFIEIKLEQINEPQTKEINFLIYKSIKPIPKELGKVLGDIESHMPNGHVYISDDKVTWAHETTHGINSVLRNKHASMNVDIIETRPVSGGGKINAFYVLQDRYFVIEEPNVKISNIATKIPQSLRGRSYNLYLINQQNDWNDYPLYIFDEWVAYTNGAACHLDLKINDRSDSILTMFNFNVYSICVAMTIAEKDSNYDDKDFKKFLKWNIERSFEYLNDDPLSLEYLNVMKHSEDAKEFRTFCSTYFGPDWTKKYFDF